MTRLMRIMVHVALVALFVRAILPAGWMPDAHAGFIICSASTLGVVHHDDASSQGQKDTGSKDHSQDCAFAHAAQWMAPPDLVTVSQLAHHTFVARIDTARAQFIAARFLPASPRAPPVRA